MILDRRHLLRVGGAAVIGAGTLGDAGASVRVTGSRCLTGGERQTSSQTHRLNPGRANGQFRRVSPAMDSRIRWLKIKNPDYSQKEGRGDLFNGPRQRTARTAG